MFVLQNRMPRKTGLIAPIRIFQYFILRVVLGVGRTAAEIYITFWGIFSNLDVTRGVRGSNLVRSTRLVELSSPVSPETLTEPTEACKLRAQRAKKLTLDYLT